MPPPLWPRAQAQALTLTQNHRQTTPLTMRANRALLPTQMKAAQAERAMVIFRPRELVQSGYLTGLLRGDANGGVDDAGNMQECQLCRNHSAGEGTITMYDCNHCINSFCGGCLESRGHVVPSSDPNEDWSCPSCVYATSSALTPELDAVLQLSHRGASTRIASRAVALIEPEPGHTAEPPKKKKRKRLAVVPRSPSQPSAPKAWQTGLLKSLQQREWPSTLELGPLPVGLPSVFLIAQQGGWCVFAPTVGYLDRFCVPRDERAQASRLLNNAIAATGFLNTAEIDGPRLHRARHVGGGHPKPYFRLSPTAQVAVSQIAARIGGSAPSQTTALQFSKQLARDAASPQDLHNAGFDNCPLCDMPVLNLDDPQLHEKRAAIVMAISGTLGPAPCTCCDPPDPAVPEDTRLARSRSLRSSMPTVI